MRIGELALAGGVPLPTVKYFLSERLLPAGTPTGRNQADYGAAHLDRLRLIRALIDVGGMSVAAVHEVLAAAARPGTAPRDLLAAVQDAPARLAARRPSGVPDELRLARATLAEAARARGWLVEPGSAAFEAAARALATFGAFDVGCMAELVEEYSQAADRLARSEVAALAGLLRTQGSRGTGTAAGPRAGSERMVLAAVIGEALFAALRRLARQQAAAHWDAAPVTAKVAPESALQDPGKPAHSRPTGHPAR